MADYAALEEAMDTHTAAEDDSSGSLTVGIEMEFLVPHLSSGTPDPHFHETRPVCFINEFLSHDPWKDIHNFTLRRIVDNAEGLRVMSDEDDELVGGHQNVVNYNRWRLTSDSSVDHQHNSLHPGTWPYRWAGKEVTSEVMRVSDQNYADKITTMCKAIRSNRVHLNRTTGVHVHVGRGNEGFTMLTLKKFSALMWLVDLPLLELHHPSRRDCKHCPLLSDLAALVEIGAYPLSPRALMAMAPFIPDQVNGVLKGQMCAIWVEEDLEGLAKLMTCYKAPDSLMRMAARGTIGYRRFLPAGKTGGNTKTIEFRQMQGSLDPEHIINWVRVCIAIVDFARLSTPTSFKAVMTNIVRAGKAYTGLDLLRDLQLDAEADYFENKVAGYRSGTAAGRFYYEGQDRSVFVRPLDV